MNDKPVSQMTDQEIKDFIKQPATQQQRDLALVEHGELNKPFRFGSEFNSQPQH